jgi:lysyl-tRNA synthetase class 1
VPEQAVLQSRVDYAAYWLRHFSPAEIRLRLQKDLPAQVANLTPGQRQALGTLGQRLQPAMDGDTIHALVYALAEEVALPAKALFEAIYIALLDQSRGPRVGWFLSSLDYDFVRTRFQDAAALGR